MTSFLFSGASVASFTQMPPPEASNLKDYEKLDKEWQVADLVQLVRTGRERTNCVDGSLMTLTTNSCRLWSKAISFEKSYMVLI